MVNKLIFLLGFAHVSFFSMAQSNINFDNDCTGRNSAILAQILINSEGKDSISKLLENNVRILIFCNVDSIGRVLSIKKTIANGVNSEGVIKRCEYSLLQSNTHFYICFEKLPGLSDSDSHKIMTKELFNHQKQSYLINIAFPGSLMTLYNYYHGNGQCQKITKYDYLIEQIKPPLPKDENCIKR